MRQRCPEAGDAPPALAASGACAARTRRAVLRGLAAGAASSLLAVRRLPASEPERTAGPFVPTPRDVVRRMLEFAQVGPRDRVYDLGCGDGRLLIAAAQRHGASGVGVDIDPDLIAASREAALRAGLADRIAFEVRDVLETDVSRATVVVLYVLPQMMARLRPKLLAELVPGARIVSHDFAFDEWLPDRSIGFESEEKRELVGIREAVVRLWVVPAHVAGRWRIEVDAAVPDLATGLTLRQRFQRLEGSAATSHGPYTLVDLHLAGAALKFGLPAGADFAGPRHVFRGRVAGALIEGNVDLVGVRRPARFLARRIEAPGEPLAR